MTTVFVKAVEYRNNGILVKVLRNGRVGFIRRREISWDRRVGIIPQMPTIGENLDAAVVEDSDETGLLYLSLRQLSDPWQSAISEKRYQPGDVLEGDVVNVQHFGAFVQLEPGIDALVRPSNVPIHPTQTIENVLWVGDKVRGVVIKADFQQREIELDIWGALRRLGTGDDRQKTQVDLLTAESEPATYSFSLANSATRNPVSESARFHPGIARPEHILVLDNEANELERICDGLRNKLHIQVDGVKSGKDAVAKVKQGISYGLVLVDLHLSAGEHGAKVADQLLEIRHDLPVLFMSGRWIGRKEQDAINALQAPLTNKQLDEIVDWIDRMCSGYAEIINRPTEPDAGENDAFIHQLGVQSFARRPLPEMLEDMLGALRRETDVTQVALLNLDSESRQVSMVAAAPPLPTELIQFSLDRLYFSPVRNVIEDEEEFRLNAIKENDPRIKNLFPQLEYQSCFGVPIVMPDQVTEHCLFLFDDRPTGFSRRNSKAEKRVQMIRMAARFLAAAIERVILLEHMRTYQSYYSRGRIWTDLTHELSNKLNALHAQVATLQALLNQPVSRGSATELERLLSDARDVTNEVFRCDSRIEELVETYRQLARGDLGSVDVNSVVEKVKNQLNFTAASLEVDIFLDLRRDIPPVRAIVLQLEQIIYNLVLNAIQQITRQRKEMERILKDRKDKAYLLPRGMIIIQTRLLGGGLACPIQIKVIDNGPGIHWQQQKRIFTMGFTKREDGMGLGLFISQNLAEMSGGKLSLARSLMLIGSMFTVDLPAFEVKGESR